MKELFAALAQAQREFPTIGKDGINSFFKTQSNKGSRYATLDNILSVIKPILLKNGLLLIQPLLQTETGLTIETRLIHVDTGQEIKSTYPVPMDDNPQKLGSKITYGRRYSVQPILGITADEDDDGNAAAGNQPNQSPPQSKKQVVIPTFDEMLVRLDKVTSPEELRKLTNEIASLKAEYNQAEITGLREACKATDLRLKAEVKEKISGNPPKDTPLSDIAVPDVPFATLLKAVQAIDSKERIDAFDAKWEQLRGQYGIADRAKILDLRKAKVTQYCQPFDPDTPDEVK